MLARTAKTWRLAWHYDPVRHRSESVSKLVHNANQPSLLEQTYDFVTCAETMEHFAQPRADWECLLGLVKHGGWLGIMTQFVTDRSRFPNWYYKRDATHVCFYSRATIQWLALEYTLTAHFYEKSVVVFQR